MGIRYSSDITLQNTFIHKYKIIVALAGEFVLGDGYLLPNEATFMSDGTHPFSLARTDNILPGCYLMPHSLLTELPVSWTASACRPDDLLILWL